MEKFLQNIYAFYEMPWPPNILRPERTRNVNDQNWSEEWYKSHRRGNHEPPPEMPDKTIDRNIKTAFGIAVHLVSAYMFTK